MADYQNATCYLLRATSGKTGTDLLASTHGEERQAEEMRCSLHPLSNQEQVSVLGVLTIGVFRCRFVMPGSLRAGERICIKVDDEAEYATYVIKQPKRLGKLQSLIVQREGV